MENQSSSESPATAPDPAAASPASAAPAVTPSFHPGSCHCGAVRFEARVDLSASPSRCNCSICQKLGSLTASIEPGAFRLIVGAPELGSYAWGGRTETRYFCKHCGVHVFARGHLPELGGDHVSLNVNALDDVDPSTLAVVHWDGRHDNWRAGPRSQPWPVFTPPDGAPRMAP
jgi:hypothetical protein